MKSDILSDISLEESIFRKSSCAILVDIFWHEIRRSNFKWFQIGIDQTMKQVIPEMILIWRVEIYCRLPFYLIQSGFIESIAIKISKFLSKYSSILCFEFSFISVQGWFGPNRLGLFYISGKSTQKKTVRPKPGRLASILVSYKMPFFVYKLTGSYIMDNYDEW